MTSRRCNIAVDVRGARAARASALCSCRSGDAGAPNVCSRRQAFSPPGSVRPPLKKCGEKDAVCLAAVMTELKTRYPEQLKVWCFRQKMDEMRNHMNAAAMADPSDPAQGGAGYNVSQAAVIKTVCTQAK